MPILPEKCSEAAPLCNILVDEDEEPCIKGREVAMAFDMVICDSKDRERSKGDKNTVGTFKKIQKDSSTSRPWSLASVGTDRKGTVSPTSKRPMWA